METNRGFKSHDASSDHLLSMTDAPTIVKGVLPTTEKLCSSATLLALGAEGASVMSGCNEGVAAKLRRRNPWLVYIHCAAHRLNLMVGAYFRKVTEANNVINVYKSLYAIFNFANHRENILKLFKRSVISNSL